MEPAAADGRGPTLARTVAHRAPAAVRSPSRRPCRGAPRWQCSPPGPARGARRARARCAGLRRSRPVRRLGRVEIRVADRGPAEAVAWGGRAVVVLDRATWRDPDARHVVVQHEYCPPPAPRPAVGLGLGAARRRRAGGRAPGTCSAVVALEELAADGVVVRRVPARACRGVARRRRATRRRRRCLSPPSPTLKERLQMLARPRTRRAPAWLLAALGLGAADRRQRPAAPDLAALAADAGSAAFPVPTAPPSPISSRR
ncbi:MAG: hypothetical protein R3F59_09435 [Myxococcota bacterium]